MSRTQVTGKGLENLAALPTLTSLSLWKAPRVTDDALPYLAALKHLRFLDLTETAITKAK